MFFIAAFCLSWILFARFVRKEQFLSSYPSALVGMVMSLASDTLTHFYSFWTYRDPFTHLNQLAVELLDDFSIYPAIAYLYVQSLPKTWRKWLAYTFVWSVSGIAAEYFLIRQGFMRYHLGWNLGWSYAADWVIFSVLTLHKHVHSKLIAASRRARVSPTGTAFISFEHQVQPVDKAHILLQNGLQAFKGNSDHAIESYFCVLEPGGTVPVHEHQGLELKYMIEGNISLTLNGQERHLQRGDIVLFPAAVPHSVRNPGMLQAKWITLNIGEMYGTLQGSENGQQLQAR